MIIDEDELATLVEYFRLLAEIEQQQPNKK
jgi:hypothetical protein